MKHQFVLLPVCLLLLLCLNTHILPAQNLYQQVERHIYFCRFAEAEQLARQALEQWEDQPVSEEYALANFCMGMVHGYKAQYRPAVHYYQQAINIWEQNDTQADTNYLRATVWLANNWRSLAHYDSAQVALQRAGRIAETCQQAGKDNLVWEYLVEQAAWYAARSEYPLATQWYADAVARQERLYGKRSPKLAKALIQQAIYLTNDLGEHHQAVAVLERAERILAKAQRQYPQEYVNTLNLLAALYSHNVPNYQVVEPTLNRALAVVDRHLGPTHRLKADLLKNLAAYLQLNTARFLEADELIQQARALNELHLGKHNIYDIGLLQDLAGWYGNDFYGYLDTAVVLRSRALVLCDRLWGNRHPSTALLMLAVARDYQNAGNQIAADSLLNQAEQVYLQLYGTRHVSRIQVLDQQRSSWSIKYNYTKADSLAQVGLALRAELWGATSPRYWEGIQDIVAVNTWYDHATADSLYRLLIPYLAQQKKEQGINYLQTKYSTRAYYFKNTGKLDSAILYTNQYMERIDALLGQENLWYLLALQQQISNLNGKNDTISTSVMKEANHRFGQIIRYMFGENSMGYIRYLEQNIDYLSKSSLPAEVIPLRREVITRKRAMGNVENSVLDMLTLAREAGEVGLYALADTLLNEALVLTERQYGKFSAYYFFVAITKVDVYIDIALFDLADFYLREAHQALNSIGNPLKMADVYYTMEEYYARAIGNYHQALESIERRKALLIQQYQDPDADAGFLNAYGLVLQGLGRYVESESYLLAALAATEQPAGRQMRSTVLNNLAVLKADQGDHAAARNYLQLTMAERAEKYGLAHPQMATAYNNYATLLQDMGQYQAAIDTLALALGILNQADGGSNADNIARYTNNMAICYDELGAYALADSLYRVALAVGRNRLGAQHPAFLFYEKNYATFLTTMGQWPAADSIFSRQLAYWEGQPYRNKNYTGTLNAYAHFYWQTGQYEKGLQYAQKAEASLDSAMRQSLDRAYALALQSDCLNGLSRATEAMERRDSALAILRRLVGKQHPRYALELRNLGAIYLNLKQYDQAEACLNEARAIREELFGTQSREVAWTLTVLAELYAAQNRLEEAEVAITQSLAIQENYGDEHLQPYFEALLQYARIAYQQGRPVLGDSIATQVRAYYATRTKVSLGYMSYGQQLALLNNASQQDVFPSLQATFPDAQLGGVCYNNALIAKSTALDGGRNLKEQYLRSGDEAKRQLYGRYEEVQQQIAGMYRQPAVYRFGLDSLERLAENLQKQLIQQSPEYQYYLEELDIDWQRVQDALTSEEAAIEYIRYREDLGEQEGGYHYAALVLRPGMAAPAWVYLCQEEDLAYWLGDEHNAIKARDYANAMTRGSFGNADEDRKTTYELSWQPLDALMTGAKRVFVSPVGLLHRAPFNALPIHTGGHERLMDYYDLVLLRSTRHIPGIKNEVEGSNLSTALLVGDVAYGMPDGEAITQRTKPWKNLQYGQEEYSVISSMLQQKEISTRSLSREAATKVAFLEMLLSKAGPPPGLIHTIVHGYYGRNANPGDTTVYDPNPLRRSGLVMAGANNLANQQDAIVLAQDISHLDLRGTQLVVLSACETGLGTAAGSEGVFGLQRAFLEAGAAQVMVSLWSVDDASTSSFMQLFYRKWLDEKLTVREAFRQAQEAMRWFTDGAGVTREADAYYWAGFILVE